MLRGAAPFPMNPGDFVNIPAHRRHRVECTSTAEPTVWLAFHYAE
jgi:cupin 2 domain-containing protein